MKPLVPIFVPLFVAVSAPGIASARCRSLEHRARQGPGREPSQRPPADISLSSAAGFPFLIHAPHGYESLMGRLRDAADRAWRREFTEGGWPTPPADHGGPDEAFDIYVDQELDTDEGYVQPEDLIPETPWDDTTSFMAVAAEFSDDSVLFGTVSHELNHGSQFAIDAYEDAAFFEHTATLAEQRAAHHPLGYGTGIADYQQHPTRALNHMDGKDLYEYGAFLWLLFLSERIEAGNDALVRELWLRSKQSDGQNEPDFVDALGPLLEEHGWSLERFFGTYALWRYFTGARADAVHFAQAAAWGAESLVPVAPVTLPGLVSARVGAYGASYALAEAEGARGVDWTREPGATVAAVQALDQYGTALGDAIIMASARGFAPLPVGTHRVLVALTAVPASYDPDVAGDRSIDVSVTLEPRRGCAQQQPSLVAAVASALLAAGAMRRRARKARRWAASTALQPSAIPCFFNL